MSKKRDYTPSPELVDLVKQYLHMLPYDYSTVAEISYYTKLSQATVRRSLKSLMRDNLAISVSGKCVSRNGARLYRTKTISLPLLGETPEVLPWWKKVLKFLKLN